VLSQKAVIEHLQLMEREAILSCETDDRCRKYYYIKNDILIDVSLKQFRVPAKSLVMRTRRMNGSKIPLQCSGARPDSRKSGTGQP
jgi:ArsR family transcriptional regulator